MVGNFTADAVVHGAEHTIQADSFTGSAASIPEPVTPALPAVGWLALARGKGRRGPGRPQGGPTHLLDFTDVRRG